MRWQDTVTMQQGKNVKFEDYLATFSNEDRQEIEKMTQVILDSITENKNMAAKETDGTTESLNFSHRQ